MLVTVRLYSVVAGTHAQDPLAVELVRATRERSAHDVAASLQAQVRAGMLTGGSQYYVRATDEEIELPVASPSDAVALGYSVLVPDGQGGTLLIGPGGAQQVEGTSAPLERSALVGSSLTRDPAPEEAEELEDDTPEDDTGEGGGKIGLQMT